MSYFPKSSEIQFTYIRAPGPGGQNVNKVATAVLLRFNLFHTSSLPESIRHRLLTLIGKKLNHEGDLLIKASRFRTQARNKQDALARLQTLLKRAAEPVKKRKKTMPTRASKQRRLDTKKIRAKSKSLRGSKIENDD
jgi:ribosome-associated protein